MSSLSVKEIALHESTEYFGGDDLAADVFMKYALRDQNDNLLESTPDDMHLRLAEEFARIEQKYVNPMSKNEIYSLLKGFKDIIPQGSPMSGVGNEYQLQSLSNCFVIDSPHDSYGGILFTDQEQVQIMKRRGGVGFDISTIRPKGQPTTNAAKTTDGIGIFMDRFSNSTREVAQGGRRGALLLSIDCKHPEIETFIDIKRNLKKVTGANISIKWSDEFMNAVKNDEEFTLCWPVTCTPTTAEITKVVRAKEIWLKYVDAAWSSAEPGAFFWDRVKQNTPADLYASFGYESISSNPCLAGETEVMVADGRGFVKIEELANSGADVPVYAYDNETGKLVIRKMRNPRKTGNNVPVYKVTIENGHSFKATGNHTMILRDDSRKQVKDLCAGDSLWIASAVNAQFNEVLPNVRNTKSQDYRWIKDCNSKSWKADHRMIWEHQNNKNLNKNEVIHHADFDGLNNNIDNLVCMTAEEHNKYHAALMRGKNNPIYKIKSNAKRFEEYSNAMSNATSGLSNPCAFDVANDVIHTHFKELTKQKNRRINHNDWQAYVKANELDFPLMLNKFRTCGKEFLQFAIDIANELNIRHDLVDVDLRTAKRAIEAESTGYNWRLVDKKLYIERTCEWCNNTFESAYNKREIAFCCLSHSLLYANRKENKNLARKMTISKIHSDKGEKTRHEQVSAFTHLRSLLMRNPTRKEWSDYCKNAGINVRMSGTKYGFKSWNDIAEAALYYNHRVVSVELIGNEDVYNGTVDNDHTFCFRVGTEKHEKFKNDVSIILANEQCGELVLCSYDSCRLMVVNLLSFVNNEFTSNASFDISRFNSVVMKAQRLMDDLVDLEIEVVDKIIQKVENDPEPAHVKQIELDLWKKIKNKCVNGRRTGLGITGLGDAIAALGFRYGDDNSIEFTKIAYKALAVAAHRSSMILAEERGAFPIFDYNLEREHVYMNKIISACDENSSERSFARMWKVTGRRNIALTTTAPVGSVSIMTQTTSGIEPAFLLSYKRRRKIVHNDTSSRVDFVDALGDKWQEYIVYHQGFKKWMDVTGKTDVKESPYFGGTANDIDWVKAVDIQAAAQAWIDHSISKTINLPNTVTKEIVNDVYMRAWESGCKGATVYRDGSRDGVLVSTEEKKEVKLQDQSRIAQSRPKQLPCELHRANIRSTSPDGSIMTESWLVLVGLLNGKPYEVFCGMPEMIEIPKKYKSGVLIKNGKKDGVTTYNLEVPVGDDESLIFKDVVTLFNNKTQGSFTRTISLALRHEVPLHYIVEQLQKDKNGDMFSFGKVIARVLKSYIKDGTKTSSVKCMQCGNTELVYQEGCLSCKNCGWGRCG